MSYQSIGLNESSNSQRPRRKEDQQKLFIDYDAVLESAGGWGMFQKILLSGTCLPVLFSTALVFTVAGEIT